MEAQKLWVSKTLLPDRTLKIRSQSINYANGYKVYLWCNSCTMCKDQKGWRCYATYDKTTNELHRKHTPASTHGENVATKKWTPLTSTTEAGLFEHVRNNPSTNTQELLKVVRAHQDQAVPERFLTIWLKNHKPASEEGRKQGRPGTATWNKADWKQAERDRGTLADVLQRAPQAWPDSLFVVDMQLDPSNTVAVFCNPALFSRTIGLLTNKAFVKLSGDGTFRLTNGDWIFLTLGVITKHYSHSTDMYVFRSTYHPLLFAVTNKESQQTYSFLFKAACRCAQDLCSLDLQAVVKQYHCDWHTGEEAARKEVFPQAVRVGDFAHFVGACARSKTAKKESAEAAVNSYRAGLPSTCTKHLSESGKKLLPLIMQTIHVARVLPTENLFKMTMGLLFDTLLAQTPSEAKLVAIFKQHYMNGMLADWWQGLHRIQPGSASGTQAQESWHRHKLKKYLKLKQKMSVFLETL